MASAHIITRGERVTLRDRRPDDVERWMRWQREGEWREYDAPWETLALPTTDERVARLRASFLERCQEEPTDPRPDAVIDVPGAGAIGWIRRYCERKAFPEVVSIGIAIAEDEHLGQGYGTEALVLWIDYLFSFPEIRRVGLATYRYNERMMRAAEKVGLVNEGEDREVVRWHDAWWSRVRYGMLRSEWEARRGAGSPT